MKKSEKIEIRISHEEKQSLAKLADSEGQTVSELVRGLARKYARLNMPRPRRNISIWHMAGLIFCGVGIGSGLAFSLGDKIGNQTPSQYMVHGVVDDNGFGFPVNIRADARKRVMLGNGIGAYQIEISIHRGKDAQKTADVNICKKTQHDCIRSATANLNLGDGTTPSVWQTQLKTGEDVFLVLQPV